MGFCASCRLSHSIQIYTDILKPASTNLSRIINKPASVPLISFFFLI